MNSWHTKNRSTYDTPKHFAGERNRPRNVGIATGLIASTRIRDERASPPPHRAADGAARGGGARSAWERLLVGQLPAEVDPVGRVARHARAQALPALAPAVNPRPSTRPSRHNMRTRDT